MESNLSQQPATPEEIRQILRSASIINQADFKPGIFN